MVSSRMSVCLSGPTNGHILDRHIFDTLHRVCFIPSISMIKMRGSYWVFFLLLSTFTFFVYGNLTLSTK